MKGRGNSGYEGRGKRQQVSPGRAQPGFNQGSLWGTVGNADSRNTETRQH